VQNQINKNLKFYVAFNQIPACGPKRFTLLLNYFPSLDSAWQASAHELVKAGLDNKLANEITHAKQTINPDEELQKVLDQDISIITIEDNIYPELLKQIHNPPYILYYRGTPFKEQDEISLAVVGSRKTSPYGTQVVEDIVTKLAQAGLCIVSGLALGIDGLAHRSCLHTQGRTIAVLGNGLDTIYPSSHTPLAREIISSGGLIISEFPINTPSYRSNFPQRNRIISGLTLGTLVIEAGEKSGSLITAKYALEQNREVFAIPGPIYNSGSKGPNSLIRQGACLVSKAEDIINELNIGHTAEIIKAKKIIPNNEHEALILSILKHKPIHIDELIRESKLDARKINAILVTMELKNMVKNTNGMNYSLVQ